MAEGCCNALGGHIYSMYKVSLNLPFLEAFPVTLMLVLHLFRLHKMAGSRDTLYIKCGLPPTPPLSCMTGSLYNCMYSIV